MGGNSKLGDTGKGTNESVIGQSLEIIGTRDLDHYEPERHRVRDAAHDYGIKEAKRIKDWPKLEEAVDAKIGEQRQFVAWWNGAVSQGHGGDRKEQVSGARYLPFREAERLTGMKQPRVSDLGKRLSRPEKYRSRLLGAEYRAAMLDVADNVRGTQGTGENEWFTPAEYIELARGVLGEIDLDPATHDEAQKTIKAARYFTKADDGLKREWHGRVWLNPPYAQPLIADFVSKMCAERRAGRVTAAIMLTHNYTDTAWFHDAASVADVICFTRGRVKFYEPDGATAAPTQGQAFFYFGSEIEVFAAAFRAIGFVARPF